MFVRPAAWTCGVGVAAPQQPIRCAPLKSSTRPSSAHTVGAKWKGVCPARLLRLLARVHVQAVVKQVCVLPLPSSYCRTETPPALPGTTPIVPL